MNNQSAKNRRQKTRSPEPDRFVDQLEIDFDRLEAEGTQRRRKESLEQLVRAARIPSTSETANGSKRTAASASTCKALLCYLLTFDRYGERIWPAEETIASDLALSVRTVRRAIAKLVEIGWMEVRRRPIRAGVFVNQYFIFRDMLFAAGRDCQSSESNNLHESPSASGGTNGRFCGSQPEDTRDSCEVTQRTLTTDPEDTDDNPEDTDDTKPVVSVLQKNKEPFKESTTKKGNGLAAAGRFGFNFRMDPPVEDARDDLGRIGQLLRESGVAHWKRFAVEFVPLGLEHVERAVAIYRANPKRLAGPGSLIAYLRDGVWPADGLIDPDAVAKRRAIARQAAEDQARAAKREQVAQRGHESDRAVKWANLSVEERDRLIDRARESNAMLAKRDRASPLVLEYAMELVGRLNETGNRQ